MKVTFCGHKDAMKKVVVSVAILSVIAVLLGKTAQGISNYADRKACVCSILTTEEQTLPIDDRLYRICPKDTLKTGTFMLVVTRCDHGRNIRLTVLPDEGKYRGCLVIE